MTDYQGLRLIPPLLRGTEGWAEQRPPACDCSSDRFLIGWRACSCRADTLAPGHRTWECQRCGSVEVLGCLEAPAEGPLDEYGCARRAGGAAQHHGACRGR